jgi:glycosyltransferase involved in cell wall biosynthesis
MVKEADIIHLHWINQGFLTPESLKELLTLNKPIIWTFHDCNAFTGGCHVRYDCQNYKQECGNCPVLKQSNDSDISHQTWKRKKVAYSGNKFHIISPSNWLADGVRQSSLLKDFPISVIPNTVPIDIFCPTPKHIAREKLGWERDKFIMLSGFMPSRVDKHKGADYLKEALEILTSKIDTKDIVLASFGNDNTENILNNLRIINLGKIYDDNILALIYSASDIFLTTTLDDNLPNTVMESLACGTPVVSFTTGGIPDMVIHKHNGYLAEYKSAVDFCNGIIWALNHTNRNQLNSNARKTVEEKFSPEIIAKQHLQLYNQLYNQ